METCLESRREYRHCVAHKAVGGVFLAIGFEGIEAHISENSVNPFSGILEVSSHTRDPGSKQRSLCAVPSALSASPCEQNTGAVNQ